VVERGPELVELLLGDALAVPGQDLVLHLVDGSEQEIRVSKLSRYGTRVPVPTLLQGCRSGSGNFSPDLDPTLAI